MARKRKAFEDIFGQDKRPAHSPRLPEISDIQVPSSSRPITPVVSFDSSRPSYSPASTNHQRSRDGQRLAFRNFLQQNSEILACSSTDYGVHTSSTIVQAAPPASDPSTTDGPTADTGNNSAPVSSINLASINSNPQNDDLDYGVSVMAQVILDRDSLEFSPLNMSDLEVVVDAARTTVTGAASDIVSDYTTATLIAYTLALTLRLLEGVGRTASSFMLKGMKIFGMSYGLLHPGGTTDLQSKTLSDIPEDIRQLERKFNLDIETTIYAVCPRCSYTYPPIFSDNSPKPTYPPECTYRPMALAEPCNESLLLDNGKPMKCFEVYSFLNWFGRFIALPGVAQYGDAFCEQIADAHPPEDKGSACDGRFYFELKGDDGKFFVRERGKEGRWFFKFHADFFNIEGNLHGGKHNSTGIMSMSCLNLPLEIREDQAYIYIPGVIQGPREPDARAGAYNHYLRPIIDELLVAYTRGIQCALSDDQQTPYERTHRVVVANISMDAKASHPFAGLVDIGSHAYCATCQTWHKAYLNSVNYEDWEAIDDEYLREGAEKWRNAESRVEREKIEHLYGVRYSEFWRLPYFSPSRQVSIDPMHALKNIFGNFFCDALRLDNPSSTKEPKNKSTTPLSSIAHYYQFTPPPRLSVINSAPITQTDADEQDLLTAVLEWDHLPNDLRLLRHQRALSLLVNISAHKRELSDIHHLLSLSQPSTDSLQTHLRSRLKNKKWGTLLYVCNDLMVFPAEISDEIARKASVTKSDIMKDDMVDTLIKWRLNDIHEDQAFVWPHFTPIGFAPPRAPWAYPILSHTFHDNVPCHTFTDVERKNRLQDIARRMNWHCATGVGHIHQLLWAPCGDNHVEREKLAKGLNTEGIDALLYVCTDLNRVPLQLPRRDVKRILIHQLIDWRMTQSLEALSWAPVDSPAVLERVRQAIQEVTVPSWITKPSEYIGLPRAGTPKADNWRRLFAIFLPLALLSMWQVCSPIAASDAQEMSSVLDTSLYLTCALIAMTKHKSRLQDRLNFREYLRCHIVGLKYNFPGWILPSHHVSFHIFDYMDLFGPVHNFWCFPGERLISRLRSITINNKIGAKIYSLHVSVSTDSVLIGEFESTLLHSFCKGSAFRRWLLRPNCPPLLKVLRRILDKAFGLNKDNRMHAHGEECEVDNLEDSEDHSQFRIATPSELISLVGSRKLECYSRIHAGYGKYYGIPSAPGKGNSFICFYPGGNQQLEWVAGQIKFVLKQDGRTRFVIRRSLPIAFDQTTPDPFRKFWAQGFQAKTVSSAFSSDLEFIEREWLLGHIARWEISESQTLKGET
ncbi:hypothetical protein HHX47_DHR7000450 [Lentinula edodes]|nr:hypothetical protein HHX47_DHR7000450 [Lentinula edodes]